MIVLDEQSPAEVYEQRTGLYYTRDRHRNVYLYLPDVEFVVDGIRYNLARSSVYYRSMVDLFDDHHAGCECANGSAEMIFSDPMTETQLDEWVRSGWPVTI